MRHNFDIPLRKISESRPLLEQLKEVNNNVQKLPFLNGARSKLNPPPIQKWEPMTDKKKRRIPKYSEDEDFDLSSNFRALELNTEASLRMTKQSGFNLNE
jgi:hypothetical protein